jgi:hypothetical protein
VIDVCVTSRRFQRRQARTPRIADPRLPTCNSVVVFLDGTRLADAVSHLKNARLADFESVTLLSEIDAMTRFGFSADGAEVLMLWSVGRRPRSRF